jgi:hypothetical protein
VVRDDKGERAKRSIGSWLREIPDRFALITIFNLRSGRETYVVPIALSSGIFVIVL